MDKAKQERLAKVNELIELISTLGRQFFRTRDCVGQIVYRNGKYYFIDDYTKQHVFMWDHRRWKNFSHGGTLKSLLHSLKEYVKTGDKRRGIVAYSFSGRNIWGYPEKDAKAITQKARELGIIPEKGGE